jgi:hypothetical protein
VAKSAPYRTRIHRWPTPRPTGSRSTRAAPSTTPRLLDRGIGIRFKGEERHNVEEYCISEGWVRVPVGKSLEPPRQSDDDEGLRPGRSLVPGRN